MKEKILDTSTEMFLSLGFKSVTMDDIADKLSISKKTIYSHFSNKEQLVEACVLELFEEISTNIDDIVAENHNPIAEQLYIHEFILNKLKEENASPQFQLYKYYPEINEKLREKKIEHTEKCLSKNLTRGIKEGFYRDDIEIKLVLNFYFMTLEGIKNSDFFSMENYPISFLIKHFLEYHFRAIVSEKGLKYINSLKHKKAI